MYLAVISHFLEIAFYSNQPIICQKLNRLLNMNLTWVITKKQVTSLLKSPHVHKKAQNHYGFLYYKSCVKLISNTATMPVINLVLLVLLKTLNIAYIICLIKHFRFKTYF